MHTTDNRMLSIINNMSIIIISFESDIILKYMLVCNAIYLVYFVNNRIFFPI